MKAVTENQQQHASQDRHQMPLREASSGAQQHEHTEGDGVGKEGRQGVAMDVDVLLPDELLSGLLTQVSIQPELLSVMNDLFDAEGMAERSYVVYFTTPVDSTITVPLLIAVLL